MKIAEGIAYVGVNDHQIDLFEGQYDVPDGMAYNSYVILDEKIAVMDSVDAHFTQEWLDKVAAAADGRTPDYLVVHHMEPDHSGSIQAFMEAYPQAVVVASAKAFDMMKLYFGTDYADRQLVVKEGAELTLGQDALRFLAAPMVHWPEVMMSYSAATKVLFSADAFGKFGALDVEQDWACEARRCSPERRRHLRSVRRSASRHLPRSSGGWRLPCRAEEGWLPDPRRPYGRAQEVRPEEGP